MRIYLDSNRKELAGVVCNKCKKELKVENGIVKEGCFHADTDFGYFSHKDGMQYSFDLCEECYDKMIAEFAIPAQVQELTELI